MTLVYWSLMLDIMNGVQYVEMGLMMMLEMWHVDSQDMQNPVMFIPTQGKYMASSYSYVAM